MNKIKFAATCLLAGFVLAGLCACGKNENGHGIPGTSQETAAAGDSGRAEYPVTAGDSGGGDYLDAAGDSGRTNISDATGETGQGGIDYFENGSGAVVWRGEQITIGFSQIGAESDWRLASSASMEDTFSIGNGYNLIFDNAQQKQENQIKAIREFIDQDVDYIVLDPIVETGWTSSLREAKEAGIPVIIVDREVRLDDKDLYTAWLGSDFRLEGDRACAWIEKYLEDTQHGQDINILHIQGTPGSTAQIGRSQALFDAAGENGWTILKSVSGDFVQAKGKEVTESALKQFADDIQVIYCENDNMAYGAIEALEEAGKRAGYSLENGDIMVVSFDSARDGLEYTLDGKIAVDTECNPLYGPALSRLILDIETGKEVEKRNYSEEGQFSAYEPVSSVTVGQEEYPVMIVTEELIKKRPY